MFFVSTIKKYIIGIVVGLTVGLWVGVNIGRDQPIYNYPFNAEIWSNKAKRTAEDIINKTKKTLREQLKDEADSRL